MRLNAFNMIDKKLEGGRESSPSLPELDFSHWWLKLIFRMSSRTLQS